MDNLTKTTVAGLAVWNYLINRVIPDRHYVTANLAATGAVVAAGLLRADPEQLGLRSGRGFRVGLPGAVAVAALAAVASRLPATRGLFDDARVRTDDVLFQVGWRIPLGTVVLEEITFRSVLPALLEGPDRTGVSKASAGLFGAWHVIPTLNTLDINQVRDVSARMKAVALAVAVTAGAGGALDWARVRSRSVTAPILIHWATNAASYVLAAQRRRAK